MSSRLKKDGTLPFVIDYRRPNATTISDTYPLPRIDDCICSLGDASVFSTLATNCDYSHIPQTGKYKYKTCFKTHSGTQRYTRVPLQERNAPATFQCGLYVILRGVCWQDCLVNLYFVIIFSTNDLEHLQNLDKVLGLYKEAGVTPEESPSNSKNAYVCLRRRIFSIFRFS